MEDSRKESTVSIIVMTILSIMFFAKEFVLLGLLFLGFVVMSLWNRSKKEKPQKFSRIIMNDAQEKGIQIPKDREVRNLLTRVYSRYQWSQRNYRQLAPKFDSVVESMWENLALSDDILDWKITLQTLLKEWPVDYSEHRADLRRKVEQTKEAAQQWKEARSEAWGLNNS